MILIFLRCDNQRITLPIAFNQRRRLIFVYHRRRRFPVYSHLVLTAGSRRSLILEAQLIVRICFSLLVLLNCRWVKDLHGLGLSSNRFKLLIISLRHITSTLILLVELSNSHVVGVGLICKVTCRCELGCRCRINCIIIDEVLNFSFERNVNWCYSWSSFYVLIKLLSSRQSHEFDISFIVTIMLRPIFLCHVLAVEDLLVVFANVLLNAGLISILISIVHAPALCQAALSSRLRIYLLLHYPLTVN